MAERNYKVGEAVPVLYQAPNAETGLTVYADILIPGDHPDSNFPRVTLLERGHDTGTYYGEFTPDEQGEWQAICYKDDGDGQVTKRYSVGAHDVHSVGEGVGSVATAVDVVDTKVGALPDAAAVNAEVDAALVEYDAATGAEIAIVNTDMAKDATVAKEATVDALDAKLNTIDGKVSSLDTPPMVS